MTSRKQPMRRSYHILEHVANKVVVYSGWTEDFSGEKRKRFQRIIEFYDPHTEKWEAKECAGEVPVPGLRGAASASSSDALYTYGGWDGDGKFVNSLHRLSANTFRWSELSRQNARGDSPIAKSGAGMTVCGDMLVVLGGYGKPHGPTQRGSSFIKNTSESDGSGWTNEFHIYHLNEGIHAMTRINSVKPSVGKSWGKCIPEQQTSKGQLQN